MPLYAALVCALVMFMLTGRYGGAVPHWIIFAIDALVFLAAALFFTFFQVDRLF